METTKVRIDKYLWAVRIYKTRSLSAQACDLEKIKIGGQWVKASRIVSENDIISVKMGPFERTLKVLKLVQNRLSAKLVPEYCEDITPQEELDRMKAHFASRAAWRQPGLGRPTKKERRDLDDFTSFEDW